MDTILIIIIFGVVIISAVLVELTRHRHKRRIEKRYHEKYKQSRIGHGDKNKNGKGN